MVTFMHGKQWTVLLILTRRWKWPATGTHYSIEISTRTARILTRPEEARGRGEAKGIKGCPRKNAFFTPLQWNILFGSVWLIQKLCWCICCQVWKWTGFSMHLSVYASSLKNTGIQHPGSKCWVRTYCWNSHCIHISESIKL
jgi:hypothetical protein